MAASYNNSFYNASTGTAWGVEPSIEVKYGTGLKYLLPNYTLAPPANFVNWNTFATLAWQQTTTHNLYLDIPGILPQLTYSGVTIFIRASSV